MDHYKLFIDGEFVEAQSGATFESIDPGTEASDSHGGQGRYGRCRSGHCRGQAGFRPGGVERDEAGRPGAKVV